MANNIIKIQRLKFHQKVEYLNSIGNEKNYTRQLRKNLQKSTNRQQFFCKIVTLAIVKLTLIILALTSKNQHNHQIEARSLQNGVITNEHCVMGNDTYSIGEYWHPTLPPFGVIFCVLCECQSYERPNTKHSIINHKSDARVQEARVHCRNYKDDCPDISACPDGSSPAIIEGRCCKSCPGDDVFPFEKSVLRSTAARKLLKSIQSPRPPPPPIRGEITTTTTTTPAPAAPPPPRVIGNSNQINGQSDSPASSITVTSSLPSSLSSSPAITVEHGEQSDLPTSSIIGGSQQTTQQQIFSNNNQTNTISIQVTGPAINGFGNRVSSASTGPSGTSVKIFQNFTGVVVIIL